MTGGVLSKTVNRTFVHAMFPEASITLTLILCWPTQTSVPGRGSWLIRNESAGVQLSVATMLPSRFGTGAEQWVPAGTGARAGQKIVGGTVSTTRTIVVAWLEEPKA